MDPAPPPSRARRWLTAARPFSLPASATPVLFGSVLAPVAGDVPFNLPLFLLSLVAMLALHAAANMYNDLIDHRRGLDTVPNPGSGALARGWLSARDIRAGALLLLSIGAGIGLLLTALCGVTLLGIGLAGVALGVLYSAPRAALKHHALGDLAVFLGFGLLGALGAWFVQARRLSLLPVAWAAPMALLTVAILHANNWRDLRADAEHRIVTVASLLGDRGSLLYYGFLVFSPFVLVTALVLLGTARPTAPLAMPPAFLVTWAAMPMAVSRWRRAVARAAPARPGDFTGLDAATGQLNLAFGLLCTLALIVHRFWMR